MRAMVYHGPGEKSWDDVPDPKIEDDTDAVVRIDSVTICGTDLHILKGDVPEMTPGRILGHEAVGTVQEVGLAVRTLRAGDRVLLLVHLGVRTLPLLPGGQFGQCRGGGGWIFGHLIDGVQAEYARVPFADNSTYAIPEGLTDEQVLYARDILPTGLRGRRPERSRPAGRHRRRRRRGPVGLAAILGAKLYSPAHDRGDRPAAAPARWAHAFGADSAVEPRGRGAPSPSSPTASAPTSRSRRSASRRRSSSAPSSSARGARRQRRRARQARDAAPRDAVDQERHHHDGSRRLVHDPRRCSRRSREVSSTRHGSPRTDSRSNRRWTRTTRSLGRERPTA